MTIKRARGKGKKLAMVFVNLRIPISTLEYYQQFPAYTTEMRRVLIKHAGTDKELKPT